jgi:hypothetical protein
MSKENKFGFDTNWYEMWMKQSKDFFSTAQENWFKNPQDHLKQIEQWMDTLKNQWEYSQLTKEQKAYQEYWIMMTKMCNEASDLMLKEWIKRSHDNNPIKSIRELYELWLECCHEVYQKSLQSKTYQDAYAEFMNAAAKFWKSAIPK